MEARELRVGNWVKTCTPNMEIMIPSLETQVQGVTIFGFVEFCHKPEVEGFKMSPRHIMGIPLSEEWLLRMGFTIIPAPSAYGFDCNNWSEKYLLRGAWNGKSWFAYEILNNGTHKEVKFVHELQNLRHALTGTELTIK